MQVKILKYNQSTVWTCWAWTETMQVAHPRESKLVKKSSFQWDYYIWMGCNNSYPEFFHDIN